MSKLLKAILVLRHYGPRTFANRTAVFLKTKFFAVQPEEYRILFDVMKSKFGSEGIMVDVGAAFGSALEPFARQGWRCFAFEPDPTNRRLLTALMQRYINVSVDPRAVFSESRKDVPFYTSEASCGIGSLAPFHANHTLTYRVDMVSLRDFFVEKHISRIHFLKIDAEGFDYFILQGFPWEQCIPDAVLCEFDETKTRRLGYSLSDMLTLLQEKAYLILVSEWKPVEKYGGAHQWRALHEFADVQIHPDAWGNIIAVRSDDMFRSIKAKFSVYKPAV